jgi:hypothetical protein
MVSMSKQFGAFLCFAYLRFLSMHDVGDVVNDYSNVYVSYADNNI